MPGLEPRALKYDLRQAQRSLTNLITTHGKTSPEYQEALKRFARLWSILRMTHSQEEFFHNVDTTPNR